MKALANRTKPGYVTFAYRIDHYERYPIPQPNPTARTPPPPTPPHPASRRPLILHPHRPATNPPQPLLPLRLIDPPPCPFPSYPVHFLSDLYPPGPSLLLKIVPRSRALCIRLFVSLAGVRRGSAFFLRVGGWAGKIPGGRGGRRCVPWWYACLGRPAVCERRGGGEICIIDV